MADDVFRLLSRGLSRKPSAAAAQKPNSATTASRPGSSAPKLDYFGSAVSATKKAAAVVKHPKAAPAITKAPAPKATSDSDSDDEPGVDDNIQMFAGQKRKRSESMGSRGSASGAEDEAARTSREEINAFRRKMSIRVAGTQPAAPFATFAHLLDAVTASNVQHTLSNTGLGTSPLIHEDERLDASKRHTSVVRRLLHNIEQSKYKEPTAIQMQSLSCMLEGRDVLGIAPTGSGKTAAFSIPTLTLLQGHDKQATAFGPRAIILTPVKELAQQTFREVERLGHGLGIRVAVLTKAVASGAAGHMVSATKDASDLIRIHTKRSRTTTTGEEDDDAHGSEEEEEEAADESPVSEVEDEAVTSDGDDDVSDDDDDNSSDADADDSEAGADDDAEKEYVVPSLPHADVLITTPLILVAALRDAVKGSKNKQAILPSLRVLVCDEADKLLELGFLEQVDEILSARPTVEGICALAGDRSEAVRGHRVHVQCSLFSATMPSGIEELAMSVLRDPIRITVGTRDAANSNVEQQLVFAGREEGKLLAIRNLIADGLRPPVLVFVQSKERAIELHRALAGEGYRVDCIHADKSPAAREDVVRKFRSGEIWMLITTDLLGRGMDFKGVNVVVNYDFPQSAVSYVHRVGRTGRAGRHGKAITYFTESDIPMLRSIANVMKISGCDVPTWMLELKQMSRREKKKMARSAPRRHHILSKPKGKRRQSSDE